MPAKSQKQKRFMAAVANNSKFANKVGVPQSVGEEFMKKSKNYMGGGMMKRYAEGDKVESDIPGFGLLTPDSVEKVRRSRNIKKRREEILGASPSGSGATRGPRNRAAEIEAGTPSDSLPEDGREVGKIPKKKPTKKMGGGKIKGYNKGGKVRGCGMARQGVRPAKMIKMKGA